MRRLFTDIARIYDRMNHVFSLGRDLVWRRKAVSALSASPRQILDLACGTGDLTFALAARFPDAAICGLDLTPAMLERAREKNAHAHVSFTEGDAAYLPFPSAGKATDAGRRPFDLVTCAFGFRNFPDKAAVLREVRRVLAPGGELLVLEFFRPTNRLLGGFSLLWLRIMAFAFVRRNAAAYAYLRTSMRTTLSVGEFVALAREKGFSCVARRFFFPCCTALTFSSRCLSGDPCPREKRG